MLLQITYDICACFTLVISYMFRHMVRQFSFAFCFKVTLITRYCFTLVIRTFLVSMFRLMVRQFTFGFVFKVTLITRTCMAFMFCHMFLQINFDICACFTLVIRTFFALCFATWSVSLPSFFVSKSHLLQELACLLRFATCTLRLLVIFSLFLPSSFVSLTSSGLYLSSESLSQKTNVGVKNNTVLGTLVSSKSDE